MRYFKLLCLPILLSLAAACPAAAEVPLVVSDIPPVGSLVAQVMGDLGAPEVLLDKGADPHSFQLRPSQAAVLANAGLVIWIGPEMSPWLDRAIGNLRGPDTDLRLLATPGTGLLDFPDEHRQTATPDHDHASVDPHAWLDPDNAAVWLSAIADRLSGLDPENAATYAANADRAQAAITALNGELAARLAPVQTQPIVVFHDAYGYFSAHYKLNVIGAISEGDATAPGAAHLRDLQSHLTATPVCLFPEVNHDSGLTATMAEGTKARIGAALDPEGAAQPNGPNLYGDMMRALAGAIADCAAP